MKDTVIPLLLSVTLSSFAALAHRQRPATSRNHQAKTAQEDVRDKEREVRQLAEQLLDGRQLAVRVYKDWQADPAAYKLVTVLLSGLTVPYTSIESAFGQMSDSTVIVALGDDQKDEVVAAGMENFTYAGPYKSGASLSIWPKSFSQRRYRWFTFVDDTREPIPHATVEIMIGSNPYWWNDTPRVLVGKAKLDEKGRLKPVKASSVFSAFLFKVSHPNYGTAPKHATRMDPVISKDPSVLLYWVPALPVDKWCVFNDALGNPLPGATVEIFDQRTWEYSRPRSIGKAKLDDKGRLEPPTIYPALRSCSFVVSDPNYGTAIVEPEYVPPDKLLTSCTVPLVRMGTKADERCIWGTVVDTNDTPVAGAIVKSGTIYAPGGGKLSLPWGSSSYPQTAKAITDKQGRFALYLPITMDDGSKLIPLGVSYAVGVEAPENLGLKPYGGRLPAGQEHKITMQPKEPQPKLYFPTFVFHDEFGPVTDRRLLREIRLHVVQHDGRRKSFSHYYWTDMGDKKTAEFTPGTYFATADWNGKHYIFEPVKLTGKSPETVVFTVEQIKEGDVIYQGQVIHGITSQPIPGAIVMSRSGPFMADASSLQPEQWDSIHAIGPELHPEDPALGPLKETFNYSKITQTDATGRFQIALGPIEVTRRPTFFAVENGFLCPGQRYGYSMATNQSNPVRQGYRPLEPNDNGYVTLTALKLFPGGTVAVDPNVPAKAKHRGVTLHWFTSADDNTPWLKDLGAQRMDTETGSTFYKKHKLKPNVAQTLYVPAGLELTLRIHMVLEYRWLPIAIPGVRLEQGELLDLGRLDFPPAVKVHVKLADSQGQPLEGIAVMHHDERGWYTGQKAITNETGIALLYVPPRSTGRFLVTSGEPGASTAPIEWTPYEVTGPEDTDKQFTLQLSDEMISRLFE
jgi:protocatechuate 3,4-dioxygenase beta subunit